MGVFTMLLLANDLQVLIYRKKATKAELRGRPLRAPRGNPYPH